MRSSLILTIFFVFLNQGQAQSLLFERACDARSSELVVSGVGDILPHSPLQRHAYAYGLDSLWQSLDPYFALSDLNYANMESPLAEGVAGRGRDVRDPGPVFDDYVYTGFPLFNAHPMLADGIARTFDVVSTANNHSMDRGSLGVDRTLEALTEAGVATTGTIHSQDLSGQWYTVLRKGNWKVAFVACTFSTNGEADPKGQVLMCFRDRAELLGLVSSLARAKGIDAVIVTPHWGETEYTNRPDEKNKVLGRELLEAGAAAVLGTHPHVIQPLERYVTSDGREGLIAYSTGNFVSNQFFKDRLQTRLGLMVFVGLSKRQGRVWVNGVRTLPIWMQSRPYEVRPITDSNAPQSMFDLVGKVVGEETLVTSARGFKTNPHCR